MGGTFIVCRLANTYFYQSWISAASESIVCGILTVMYMRFVSKIYLLIDEIDLDLAPVKKNFFQSISAVTLLFIITVSDACMKFLIFGEDPP